MISKNINSVVPVLNLKIDKWAMGCSKKYRTPPPPMEEISVLKERNS
jgi:hypothetical protein